MNIANIWAVGRNYSDHAKEMGYVGAQADPLIFLKAGSCAVPNGANIILPKWSNDVHHEIEVALRFGARQSRTDNVGGTSSSTDFNKHDLYIDAFTIALDLTARDVQARLKKESQPWTLAKSFKGCCPIGEFVPLQKSGLGAVDLQNLEFELNVNGERRQHGFTKDMIFNISSLCEYVLSRFPVCAGDVLLTGTPAGVAALQVGDDVQAEIKGHVKASWSVI